jgi:flagellar biosynthetic protein FliR
VTLIFATDLHHVALLAIKDSYLIFSPSDPLMLGDAAEMAIQSAASAFVIGVQMSAPFIVLGLVFYLGMGILGRMMPQCRCSSSPCLRRSGSGSGCWRCC